MKRREFLKTVTVAAAVPAAMETMLGPLAAANPAGDQAGNGQETTRNGMLYRPLGRTGVQVSALGLGGYHIGIHKEVSESIRIIRTAIDNGITFLDNSWDYNNGQSEIRMGKALQDGYRQKAFLMTKIDGRTKESAAQQLEDSLRRFQTDHIDLVQHHEVIRLEDPDRIFAPGGANEALVEAKQAGKIRFIGFTGHKDPLVHLRMLEVAARHHFHFDTVQMPLNVMDAHFRSFTHKVVPVAVKEGIGVLGMKPLGSGMILRSKTVTPVECLHYALNLPTSTVITGMDTMAILKQGLEAVRSFHPLSQEQVAALLARTAQAAATGRYERFKTDNIFDATARHPDWLG